MYRCNNNILGYCDFKPDLVKSEEAYNAPGLGGGRTQVTYPAWTCRLDWHDCGHFITWAQKCQRMETKKE